MVFFIISPFVGEFRFVNNCTADDAPECEQDSKCDVINPSQIMYSTGTCDKGCKRDPERLTGFGDYFFPPLLPFFSASGKRGYFMRLSKSDLTDRGIHLGGVLYFGGLLDF